MSYFSKCWGSTTSSSDQCLRQLTLLQPRAMSGTFSGAPQVARVIFMRALMNTKKSIIGLRVTRLQERIDFASTSSECKRDLESSILTLFQTLIFYRTNLVSSMSIIRSLSNTTAKRIFGLLSLQMPPRVEVSNSLMISTMWTLMSSLLSLGMLPTHC